MRLIHVADLHFGKSLHGVNLLESGDQPHWADEFLKLAAELRPDAVLIAGDVYDRGAPAAGAVALLSRMTTELTELGAAVLIAVGIAVFSLVRQKKSKKGGCIGNCASCGGCCPYCRDK